MKSTLLDLLQAVTQKGLPLLLNFLDDALLLGLSRLGVSLPWLEWLGMILLLGTLTYWAFRVVRFLARRHST